MPPGERLHVIGDLHGQYYDLLRIFENHGLPREGMRFDAPPPAAEARFDTRRRNLAWGEKQPSKRRTEQYSSTASIAFSMLGVEVFDVASNFST